MTRYQVLSIIAAVVLALGAVAAFARLTDTHTARVGASVAITAAVPMATIATTNTADGRCHEDMTCWQAFRPSCSHLTGTARTECVYDIGADSWAYVGRFSGHGGCWQITDGDGNGVIVCADGYGFAEHVR